MPKKIKIQDQPREQFWDETNECFIYGEAVKGCELTLEHSLLSISKWESIWHKPFLAKDKDEYTVDELLSYIECMTITPSNIDPNVYKRLSQSQLDEILTYINDPATATTIGGSKKTNNNGKFITSELVYYWMIKLEIPFECQKWNFNRLITLIRVCEEEEEAAYNNSKGYKGRPNPNVKSPAELRREYDRLNDIRRAKMHTKG